MHHSHSRPPWKRPWKIVIQDNLPLYILFQIDFSLVHQVMYVDYSDGSGIQYRILGCPESVEKWIKRQVGYMLFLIFAKYLIIFQSGARISNDINCILGNVR